MSSKFSKSFASVVAVKLEMEKVPRVGVLGQVRTRRQNHGHAHWTSTLKLPRELQPTSWKWPNICFLLLVVLSTILLVCYAYVYDEIGPADSNQNAAYILFFIANSGLIVSCLWAFGFNQGQITDSTTTPVQSSSSEPTSAKSHRPCFLIFVAFTLILLVSLVAAILFNLEPDAESTKMFLRDHLEKFGEPTKFFSYVQSHASCCGALSYNDYKMTDDLGKVLTHQIPKSCCKNQSLANCTDDRTLIFQNGCYSNIVVSNSNGNKSEQGKEQGRPLYSIENPELGKMLNLLTLYFPGGLTSLSTTAIILFSYFQCWKTSPKVVTENGRSGASGNDGRSGEGTNQSNNAGRDQVEEMRRNRGGGEGQNGPEPSRLSFLKMRKVVSARLQRVGKGRVVRSQSHRNSSLVRPANKNKKKAGGRAHHSQSQRLSRSPRISDDLDLDTSRNLLLPPRDTQSHIPLDSFLMGNNVV